MLEELRVSLRQALLPPEFRIPAPAWPEPVHDCAAEIVRLLGEIASQPPDTGDPPPGGDGDEHAAQRLQLLAEVGTGLWRLRKRLQPMGEQPDASRETRSLWLSLNSTWNLLVQGGFEIRDHTGEKVVGGESYDKIFQPTEGLARDEVIETVSPTVFWQDRLVKRGSVVVGTPPEQ